MEESPPSLLGGDSFHRVPQSRAYDDSLVRSWWRYPNNLQGPASEEKPKQGKKFLFFVCQWLFWQIAEVSSDSEAHVQHRQQ